MLTFIDTGPAADTAPTVEYQLFIINMQSCYRTGLGTFPAAYTCVGIMLYYKATVDEGRVSMVLVNAGHGIAAAPAAVA